MHIWPLFLKFLGNTLGLLIPGMQKALFGSLVKKAGKGVLKTTPLRFHAPNLLVTAITVCGINGLNFIFMIFLTDSKLLSLISAFIVSSVTAFFLLRGFFYQPTKRERITLLIMLLLFFVLFVEFLFVLEIVWLALVAKFILEVILCFAVMLAEVRRLSQTQSRAVSAVMRKLKIAPEKAVGRFILWLFRNKTTPINDPPPP